MQLKLLMVQEIQIFHQTLLMVFSVGCVATLSPPKCFITMLGAWLLGLGTTQVNQAHGELFGIMLTLLNFHNSQTMLDISHLPHSHHTLKHHG